MKKFMFPLAFVALMLTPVATWAIPFARPPVSETWTGAHSYVWAAARQHLPIDLDRWCKARYGSYAYAVVKQPNAYGWVCIANDREFPIDVADAARMEYGPNVGVAFRSWNDPYSWYAFFTR